MKKIIEKAYGITIIEMKLFRDMIGKVYHVKSNDKSYMFKIYRSHEKESALSSVSIMRYLYENQGPAPKIYNTLSNQPFIQLEGKTGVLFDYVEGEVADKNKHEKPILESVFLMHKLMNSYPHSLIERNHLFYIDRYIEILDTINFDQIKTNKLKLMGDYFFDQVKHLKKGFCHGDLHTGNIIIDHRQSAMILDYDVSGILSPMVDYMTYFDQTNFNKLNRKDVMDTINVLKKHKFIHQDMIRFMMAMIPVRHYEIIATIIKAQGLEDIAHSFFEEQYDWITKFYEIYQEIFV
ncbi:hypothetical protein BK010_09025 [Tenericutes bacterium MO-XQ]|nr:hypothetical protein BK010_09025 [Tenericutes bacterium MO-XQ]